jgi:hypothetical protein
MRTTTMIAALTIGTLVVTGVAQSDWQIEEVDAYGDVGYGSSIALDSNDYPYISYGDKTNDYFIKCAMWDGSSWQIDTVDTGKDKTSIALDTSGNPHISYHYSDYSNNGLGYAYYDGANWHGNFAGYHASGRHSSIALDSSDNPHISHSYYNEELMYSYYNGSSWEHEVVDDDHMTGEFTSIALDSSERPHISYYRWWDETVKYAHYTGSSWVIEDLDNVGSSGDWTSIAIDTSDNPHISYYDSDTNDLMYAYHDGSSWTIETVPDVVGNPGRDLSLALDASDNPHISYANGYKLKYAYYDGSTWNIEVVDTVSDPSYLTTSIALDSSGNPHISYYDDGPDNLFYAYYVDTGIEDGDTPTTPTGFALHPAVPNPSDGSATIGFALPYACELELALYDVKGRKIATLAEGSYQPGEYSATVDDLSSGVYIYEIKADEFNDSKKMVVK